MKKSQSDIINQLISEVVNDYIKSTNKRYDTAMIISTVQNTIKIEPLVDIDGINNLNKEQIKNEIQSCKDKIGELNSILNNMNYSLSYNMTSYNDISLNDNPIYNNMALYNDISLNDSTSYDKDYYDEINGQISEQQSKLNRLKKNLKSIDINTLIEEMGEEYTKSYIKQILISVLKAFDFIGVNNIKNLTYAIPDMICAMRYFEILSKQGIDHPMIKELNENTTGDTFDVKFYNMLKNDKINEVTIDGYTKPNKFYEALIKRISLSNENDPIKKRIELVTKIKNAVDNILSEYSKNFDAHLIESLKSNKNAITLDNVLSQSGEKDDEMLKIANSDEFKKCISETEFNKLAEKILKKVGTIDINGQYIEKEKTIIAKEILKAFKYLIFEKKLEFENANLYRYICFKYVIKRKLINDNGHYITLTIIEKLLNKEPKGIEYNGNVVKITDQNLFDTQFDNVFDIENNYRDLIIFTFMNSTVDIDTYLNTNDSDNRNDFKDKILNLYKKESFDNDSKLMNELIESKKIKQFNLIDAFLTCSFIIKEYIAENLNVNISEIVDSYADQTQPFIKCDKKTGGLIAEINDDNIINQLLNMTDNDMINYELDKSDKVILKSLINYISSSFNNPDITYNIKLRLIEHVRSNMFNINGESKYDENMFIDSLKSILTYDDIIILIRLIKMELIRNFKSNNGLKPLMTDIILSILELSKEYKVDAENVISDLLTTFDCHIKIGDNDYVIKDVASEGHEIYNEIIDYAFENAIVKQLNEQANLEIPFETIIRELKYYDPLISTIYKFINTHLSKLNIYNDCLVDLPECLEYMARFMNDYKKSSLDAFIHILTLHDRIKLTDKIRNIIEFENITNESIINDMLKQYMPIFNYEQFKLMFSIINISTAIKSATEYEYERDDDSDFTYYNDCEYIIEIRELFHSDFDQLMVIIYELSVRLDCKLRYMYGTIYNDFAFKEKINVDLASYSKFEMLSIVSKMIDMNVNISKTILKALLYSEKLDKTNLIVNEAGYNKIIKTCLINDNSSINEYIIKSKFKILDNFLRALKYSFGNFIENDEALKIFETLTNLFEKVNQCYGEDSSNKLSKLVIESYIYTYIIRFGTNEEKFVTNCLNIIDANGNQFRNIYDDFFNYLGSCYHEYYYMRRDYASNKDLNNKESSIYNYNAYNERYKAIDKIDIVKLYNCCYKNDDYLIIRFKKMSIKELDEFIESHKDKESLAELRNDYEAWRNLKKKINDYFAEKSINKEYHSGVMKSIDDMINSTTEIKNLVNNTDGALDKFMNEQINKINGEIDKSREIFNVLLKQLKDNTQLISENNTYIEELNKIRLESNMSSYSIFQAIFKPEELDKLQNSTKIFETFIDIIKKGEKTVINKKDKIEKIINFLNDLLGDPNNEYNIELMKNKDNVKFPEGIIPMIKNNVIYWSDRNKKSKKDIKRIFYYKYALNDVLFDVEKIRLIDECDKIEIHNAILNFIPVINSYKLFILRTIEEHIAKVIDDSNKKPDTKLPGIIEDVKKCVIKNLNASESNKQSNKQSIEYFDVDKALRESFTLNEIINLIDFIDDNIRISISSKSRKKEKYIVAFNNVIAYENIGKSLKNLNIHKPSIELIKSVIKACGIKAKGKKIPQFNFAMVIIYLLDILYPSVINEPMPYRDISTATYRDIMNELTKYASVIFSMFPFNDVFRIRLYGYIIKYVKENKVKNVNDDSNKNLIAVVDYLNSDKALKNNKDNEDALEGAKDYIKRQIDSILNKIRYKYNKNSVIKDYEYIINTVLNDNAKNINIQSNISGIIQEAKKTHDRITEHIMKILNRPPIENSSNKNTIEQKMHEYITSIDKDADETKITKIVLNILGYDPDQQDTLKLHDIDTIKVLYSEYSKIEDTKNLPNNIEEVFGGIILTAFYLLYGTKTRLGIMYNIRSEAENDENIFYFYSIFCKALQINNESYKYYIIDLIKIIEQKLKEEKEKENQNLYIETLMNFEILQVKDLIDSDEKGAWKPTIEFIDENKNIDRRGCIIQKNIRNLIATIFLNNEQVKAIRSQYTDYSILNNLSRVLYRFIILPLVEKEKKTYGNIDEIMPYDIDLLLKGVSQAMKLIKKYSNNFSDEQSESVIPILQLPLFVYVYYTFENKINIVKSSGDDISYIKDLLDDSNKTKFIKFINMLYDEYKTKMSNRNDVISLSLDPELKPSLDQIIFNKLKAFSSKVTLDISNARGTTINNEIAENYKGSLMSKIHESKKINNKSPSSWLTLKISNVVSLIYPNSNNEDDIKTIIQSMNIACEFVYIITYALNRDLEYERKYDMILSQAPNLILAEDYIKNYNISDKIEFTEYNNSENKNEIKILLDNTKITFNEVKKYNKKIDVLNKIKQGDSCVKQFLIDFTNKSITQEDNVQVSDDIAFYISLHIHGLIFVSRDMGRYLREQGAAGKKSDYINALFWALNLVVKNETVSNKNKDYKNIKNNLDELYKYVDSYYKNSLSEIAPMIGEDLETETIKYVIRDMYDILNIEGFNMTNHKKIVEKVISEIKMPYDVITSSLSTDVYSRKFNVNISMIIAKEIPILIYAKHFILRLFNQHGQSSEYTFIYFMKEKEKEDKELLSIKSPNYDSIFYRVLKKSNISKKIWTCYINAVNKDDENLLRGDRLNYYEESIKQELIKHDNWFKANLKRYSESIYNYVNDKIGNRPVPKIERSYLINAILDTVAITNPLIKLSNKGNFKEGIATGLSNDDEINLQTYLNDHDINGDDANDILKVYNIQPKLDFIINNARTLKINHALNARKHIPVLIYSLIFIEQILKNQDNEDNGDTQDDGTFISQLKIVRASNNNDNNIMNQIISTLKNITNDDEVVNDVHLKAFTELIIENTKNRESDLFKSGITKPEYDKSMNEILLKETDFSNIYVGKIRGVFESFKYQMFSEGYNDIRDKIVMCFIALNISHNSRLIEESINEYKFRIIKQVRTGDKSEIDANEVCIEIILRWYKNNKMTNSQKTVAIIDKTVTNGIKTYISPETFITLLKPIYKRIHGYDNIYSLITFLMNAIYGTLKIRESMLYINGNENEIKNLQNVLESNMEDAIRNITKSMLEIPIENVKKNPTGDGKEKEEWSIFRKLNINTSNLINAKGEDILAFEKTDIKTENEILYGEINDKLIKYIFGDL